MTSDTPLTDAEAWMPADCDECVVSAYFARQLERDLAAAIKQRDEARRMICEDQSYNHKSGVTPREVAEDRGWDCFAQKEGGGA